MPPARAALISILALSALALGAVPGSAVAQTAALRLVTAPEGNLIRVSLQQEGMPFAGNPAGTIRAVTGALVLGGDGQPLPDESYFTMDLTSLNSGWATFDPTAELVVTTLHGLPFPIPATGRLSFFMVGTLNVGRVQQPTYWRVEADAVDGGLRGTATTQFGWWTPGPRAVSTRTRLEFDLHLVPAGVGRSTR